MGPWIVCIVFMSAVLFASMACAADVFYVETRLQPISSTAAKSIQEYESRSGEEFDCALQGMSIALSESGKPADLIVTTKDGCQWGPGAAPVWVLRNENGKYSVVLNFVTYNLELLKDLRHGLKKIKTSRGTAGYEEVQLWAYNGKIYETTESYYFSNDDEKSCKAHPDFCPFEF